MIPGHRKTDLMKKLFGEMKLGDVKIPLSILVDGVGDEPKIFNSFDQDHKDIELYKIIDGTTALPAIFPSVLIGKKHYFDPALISTSPTTIAYFIGKRFLHTDRFRMISIGTDRTYLHGKKPVHNDEENETSPRKCEGIIDQLRHGLLTQMFWRRDILMEKLIKDEMEDRFLRIEASIDVDDQSTFRLIHDNCRKKAKEAYEAGCAIMVQRGWMTDHH
jgi:predicted acylesterase/phospholipase RssA